MLSFGFSLGSFGHVCSQMDIWCILPPARGFLPPAVGASDTRKPILVRKAAEQAEDLREKIPVCVST